MYRAPDPAQDRSIIINAFNSKVFGLDRTNGQVVWYYEIDHNLSTVDLQLVDNVVVAVTSQHLVFLDYRTGRLLKTVGLGTAGGGRPTLLIDGGFLYIAVQGETTCFTPAGDRVWYQRFTGHGYGAVAMALPGNVRQADYK